MNKFVYTNSASELQIQRALCDYLKAVGIPHTVSNSRLYFVNGKPRREVSTDGWFDVTLCYKGRFVGIETKSARGKLRPSQIALHEQVKRHGGVVIVARSLEDLVKGLNAV